MPVAIEEPLLKTETLQEMSDRIAVEYKVSTTTLANLVWSESRWDPNAISKTGDHGLVQINLEQPPILEKGQLPIIEEQAHNPEFSLRFAAKALSLGMEDSWVVCNCFSYVMTKLGRLPRLDDILPGSPAIRGAIAIFNYDGVRHIAYTEEVNNEWITVSEANYIKCRVGQRTIHIDDPALRGFYIPPQGG